MTKLQFKYGQFTQQNGRQLSIDNPGLVVFNGKYQEIYVDGKTFGMSDESVQALLARVQTLEDFREAMRVEEYAQAQITVNLEDNKSELLIANIGQGTGDEGANDGKIFSTGNFAVKLDGVYADDEEHPEENNHIATQSTVKTAVDNLRAEILGTIDPEELEKTLDTIKEIQDLLLNGSYTIEHTYEDPETHETVTKTIPTERVVTTDDQGQVISIEYTDGDEENPTVYATEDPTTGEITYEEGYSNLVQVAPIDSLVADVSVSENKNKQFVEATREDADVTIGVKYGTFKTGHGNVMDETSNAFVDGIATVADVQKYIEERFTWVSYEVDAQEVADSITNTPGENVNIGSNSQVPESLIITNNN